MVLAEHWRYEPGVNGPGLALDDFNYAGRGGAHVGLELMPRALSESASQLWITGGDWAWRVWSITRSGEIAFSEVRTFVH